MNLEGFIGLLIVVALVLNAGGLYRLIVVVFIGFHGSS